MKDNTCLHRLVLPMSSDGSAKYEITADSAVNMLKEMESLHSVMSEICNCGAQIVNFASGEDEKDESAS